MAKQRRAARPLIASVRHAVDWGWFLPKERMPMQISPDTRTQHKKYLAQIWRIAAPLAYQMSCEQGRGAVVIFERKPQSLSAPLDDVPMHICCLAIQELSQRLGVEMHPDTQRILTEYDPELEVVFIIIGLDGGEHTYRLASSATPKRLFFSNKYCQ